MTQIILKNSVNSLQMSELMQLIDSWNVKMDITEEITLENKNSLNFFQTQGDYGKLVIMTEIRYATMNEYNNFNFKKN